MKLTCFAWAIGLSHLASAAQYPRLPYDDNTIRTCSYWYDNKHNVTCQQVRDEDWEVSPADFHRWNPTISETCDGWTAGHSYCVAVLSERSSSSSISSSTESTTTTTTTASTTPIYSAVWTGRGCYADVPDLHPFQTQLSSPSGNDLTRIKCEDACWKASYPFVGLKAGVECWCGEYVNGQWSSSDTDCNVPCAGNRSEICGGNGVFNVLEGNRARPSQTTTTTTTPPVTTTTKKPVTTSTSSDDSESTRSTIPLPTETASWQKLGCYRDLAPKTSRTLGQFQYRNEHDLTVESCQTTCIQRGFIYSGVENGRECWCDQQILSPANNTEVALSDCSKACPGNPRETCGSGARILLSKYSLIPLEKGAPYSEDFSSGNLLPWKVYDGQYDASSQAMVAWKSPGGKVFLDGSDFSDFMYELDLTMTQAQGGSNVGLMFRSSNPGQGLNTYDGYFAVFGIGGQAQFGNIRHNWTEIAKGTTSLKADVKYHVMVRAIGKTMDLFINDMAKPVITANDATFTHGMVGARVFYTNATFDNVQVSPLQFDSHLDTKRGTEWQDYDVIFDYSNARMSTTDSGKTFIKDRKFQDFIYEADVNVQNGPIGLLFRIYTAGGGIERFSGYYAGLNTGAVTLSFSEVSANVMTEIKGVKDASIQNGLHKLRVKALGKVISIYVDDMTTPKITVTDDKYNVEGMAGVRIVQNSGYVANVRVWGL